MLCLQRSQIHVVVAFHPHLSQRLEPCRREHFDVFSALCDIAVFGALGAANDEVRYVRSEVELDGSAHLRPEGRELCLVKEVRCRYMRKCGHTYALLGGNRRAAEDGPGKGQLACPYVL